MGQAQQRKLESEHFSVAELACRCGACTYTGMDAVLLAMLEQVRAVYGKPMVVSSAYRCPTYNQRVSTTGSYGPHTTGKAVDIAVHGAAARILLSIVANATFLDEAGQGHYFTGIGVNQRGPHSGRFIHLDVLQLDDARGPRPWIWTY